jgi:hypothetical protein
VWLCTPQSISDAGSHRSAGLQQSAGRGCTVSELAAGQREAACARQIQPQKPTWFRRQGRCRRVPPIRARAAPRQVRGDSRRLYRQRAAGRQQRGADGDSGCRCHHRSTVLLLYRYAVLAVCSDVLAALAATRWSPGCPAQALRGAAGGGARAVAHDDTPRSLHANVESKD